MIALRRFKEKIEYLHGKRKYNIREKYIDSFVNINCEHYIKFIKNTAQYIDGICYKGYLWDCIFNLNIITWDDIIAYKEKLLKVMILWDIHPKERILIKNYWKFGKDSVLEINYEDIIDNINYFPEDVYIFDNSFKWSLILTHEYDDKGNRICARTGDI